MMTSKPMNMNMNMNPNAMIDNVKSMMLTMIMMKGTTDSTSGGGPSSLFNAIVLMLFVSCLDMIADMVKQLLARLSVKIKDFLSQKAKNIPMVVSLGKSERREKTASIVIRLEIGSKNPLSDAIIDLLTNLPHIKCILFQNGHFHINNFNEVVISKEIFARLTTSPSAPLLVKSDLDASGSSTTSSSSSLTESNASAVAAVANKPSDQVGSETHGMEKQGPSLYVELYSFVLDMTELRNEMNQMVTNYLVKLTNKLGNNLYYFSEKPMVDAKGKSVKNVTDTLCFSMKHFVTNRSFKNLHGKDIRDIRNRVEFFRDNKAWYDAKGVPYTLGVMMSGDPGSGKTSLIKCLANELKRHIVNVHLTDEMTTMQLENLFYSDKLGVVENGKSETFTIPVANRLYVFEDIDCQCKVVADRETLEEDERLKLENAQLKATVGRLQDAINKLMNGGRVVDVMGGTSMDHNGRPTVDDIGNKITLSFLLNLFDGILETPGRVIVVTTNFMEKLDKAFTRPGRIDIARKLGLADSPQLVEMIEHRYDVSLTEQQRSIVMKIGPCITPADASRILFENFNDLDGALSSLTEHYTAFVQKERERKEAQQRKDEELKQKLAEEEKKRAEEDAILIEKEKTRAGEAREPMMLFESDTDIVRPPFRHKVPFDIRADPIVSYDISSTEELETDNLTNKEKTVQKKAS